MAAFWRDDRGQAIVIIGAAMTILLGSLALSVDWGHGFAVRRSLQNAADAAAMAVGRTLATSTIVIDDELRFLASDEVLWEYADSLVQANRGLADPVTFTLEYGDETPNWTASEGAGSDEQVPDDTVYVRVRTSTTYNSLFAGAVGVDQVSASASARVRLSGADTPTTGPVLPFARNLRADLFSASCDDDCADPTDADPISLWIGGGGGDEDEGGELDPTETHDDFSGVLDLSRYSHSEAEEDLTALQLVEDWDRSGSAAAGTPLKDDESDDECDGDWDTAGNERDRDENQECSVPNWFYYGYGGEISLTSRYDGTPYPREQPTSYNSASKRWCELTDAEWQATHGFVPYVRAACDEGDWIETVPDEVHRDMTDALRARIQDLGATAILSDLEVRDGQNEDEDYDNAITVLIFLWDCGEEFDRREQEGDRWDLLLPDDEDCTNMPTSGRDQETPDRVHVMAVAPFTIYEGLVSRDEIRGYWGGWFGEPPADGPRPLWVFANTAYLVPDED